MVRTQIDLTREERDGLNAVGRATDRTQSAIIHEAGDRYLELTGGDRRATVLDRAAGTWKNWRGLPDLGVLRCSWDRG